MTTSEPSSDSSADITSQSASPLVSSTQSGPGAGGERDENSGHNEHSRIRVAVVYGGCSSEHSISCVSAGAVISHLDPDRYQVVPIGITRDGCWVVGSSDPKELSIRERQLPEVKAGTSLSLSLDPQHAGRFVYADGPDVGQVFADVDVIFPVLHGRFGEDGTVQGLFDMASVPYVGAGVLASAASMDKEFTKKLAAAEGLPIGRDVVLRETRSLTEEEKNLLGLPVFVKPARGGSSIGISKVDQWDELDDALDLARQHDSNVIVESMIVGTEVECGVLQRPDGTVEASLPAQLEDTESGDEGFYGFDTKYLDNVITAQIPPHFDDDTIRHIRELAVETFHALDCEGLARVDFFVTDRGPVLNEINTMPGFTPISMYPQMFGAMGIDYPDLLDLLIQRAMVAHPGA